MGFELRVAVAGAGFASGYHLEGWRRVPNATIVGICDPDAAKAQARAREFGIPAVFNDARTMLETARPHAIDIAAPLSTHVPLCRLAAGCGVHILCQKPLAASVEEARALANELPAGVRLMVHENWRFRAHYRQIKRWLDAGAIGTPVSCRFEVRASGLLPDETGAFPQLVRQPFCALLPRFLIGEGLIHHLDVIRWLLGPMRVVAARTGRLCPRIRGEDHAVVLLEGRHCWVALDGNYAAPGAPPTLTDRLEIVGTRGVAGFEGSDATLRADRHESVSFDLTAGYGDSYAAAIAHFAGALANGTPFETDVADNLATLALVEDAYAKARPLD